MYFKIIHNSTYTCEFLDFLFKYILISLLLSLDLNMNC